MPRIRSIRPETWSDRRFTALTLQARLFYIALWTWADDEGRGRLNPRELEGWAFPNDPDLHAAPCIEELVKLGRIQVYEVDGQRYFQIGAWAKHQRPQRPTPSRFPAPPDVGEPCQLGLDGVPVKPLSDSRSTRGGVAEGSRRLPRQEIGNRSQESGSRNLSQGERDAVEDRIGWLREVGYQIRDVEAFRQSLRRQVTDDPEAIGRWGVEAAGARGWDCGADGHRFGDLEDERGRYCFACHVWAARTTNGREAQ